MARIQLLIEDLPDGTGVKLTHTVVDDEGKPVDVNTLDPGALTRAMETAMQVKMQIGLNMMVPTETLLALEKEAYLNGTLSPEYKAWLDSYPKGAPARGELDDSSVGKPPRVTIHLDSDGKGRVSGHLDAATISAVGPHKAQKLPTNAVVAVCMLKALYLGVLHTPDELYALEKSRGLTGAHTSRMVQ